MSTGIKPKTYEESPFWFEKQHNTSVWSFINWPVNTLFCSPTKYGLTEFTTLEIYDKEEHKWRKNYSRTIEKGKYYRLIEKTRPKIHRDFIAADKSDILLDNNNPIITYWEVIDILDEIEAICRKMEPHHKYNNT